MLGPALSLLFEQLDGRKDELTPYEVVLHKELLAFQERVAPPDAEMDYLGNLSRPRKPRLKTSQRDEFGGPVESRVLRGQGSGGRRHGDVFSAEVDLSSDSGVPQLQINCNATNCPNKKRK